MVARQLWELEAQVRAVALGKPGKPWDTWADSIYCLAGNWSKNDLDHMFDHNWKNFISGCSAVGSALAWENTPSRINKLNNRV